MAVRSQTEPSGARSTMPKSLRSIGGGEAMPPPKHASRQPRGGSGGPKRTLPHMSATPTLALAEELAGRDDLRVFTNNLRAAIALSTGRTQVYVLGGQLRGPEFA